jgi:ribonucleoside-diphosphate reductase alpha chain
MPPDLPGISLTDNARQVLIRRYVRRGDDGEPAESVEEMFWRVAYHIAVVEKTWNEDVMERARAFYELLTSKRFFPNSPTFTGAGTPLGQLAACFVLPITDDMGRDAAGIFTTLRNAALIQQTGGGNGFSFSRLRPKGALVKSSAGQATGPVGFLRVYDNAFGEIAQGGSRRGANMGVLRVDHPDVEEFITCKIDENAITNFNISVGITDAFMQAVEADADWDLVFPDISKPEYRKFSGTIEQARAAGIPLRTHKTVRARELFDKIVRQAHHNGEPGVLFLDAANRENPVPHLYQLESTNPCFIGSTRIATSAGYLRIEELAENGAALLVGTDNRAATGGALAAGSGVAYRMASPAWKTRENTPVFRLVTRHGYTVTATADHPFLTSNRGYVAMQDLLPTDRLLLQSQEGSWSTDDRLPNLDAVREKMAGMALAGDHASGHLVPRRDFMEQYSHLPERWSHDLGLVMGFLVGDGWLSGQSGSPLGVAFATQHVESQAAFHSPMQDWFGTGHLHQRGSLVQITYGQVPYQFFKTLGVWETPAGQKRVPESIWSAPREAVVGFLQGLFTSDGTVNLAETKRSCSIRLASASVEMLNDVQLLLLNFGIVSKIHRRRAAGLRRLPDGKGAHKLYAASADYELLIDKANRDVFLEKIGFIESAKQQKAEAFVQSKARRSNRETFETTVARIEPAGTADVYDLTEPATHSLIANGLAAHNCGEQWLGPFENCCLGSVNLAQHLGENGTVDWEKLRESVALSTIFLDDVVEANAYVPAVPQLKEAAHRARRIGLGIMGLADLMYHAGIRYGSEEGQEFGAQVMEFVRYHAMKTSAELARARGPFPAIEGSIYDPQQFQWKPPAPLQPYTRDWSRPAVDWDGLVSAMRADGIRNAAQTTIAPTGTIATVAGCEGYGCEPVFALAYIRHVNDNGKDLQLTYASPAFEKALEDLHIAGEERQRILNQIMREGSCQGVDTLPEDVRSVFVTSADITAEEHVYMQAALQAFVDNSLSKTVNFPAGATEEEVATTYLLAWRLGCKGITVYVTGSRDKVVLETHATAGKKKGPESAIEIPSPTPAEQARALEQLHIWHEAKKPRPRFLPGYTYSIQTPLGEAFVTINENGHSQPFEVFINTAKAGSDTAAVSEAIGRLISYVMRLASPVEPSRRLEEVVRQLSGIGGGRPLGFGPNRVRSLPDGVAQVLTDYLEQWNERQAQEAGEATPPAPANGSGGYAISTARPILSGASTEQPPLFKIGDLCPECGQAAVVNEEGCRKCYACGFSEC